MDRPIITALDTKTAILKKAKRKGNAVPIRRSFVQQGAFKVPKPGPLADMVRRHDDLGLDLYLLALAAASADPYAIHYPMPTLARACNLHSASVSTVSKALRRLEELQLVSRGRYKRLADITLLREDGSGAAYSHPGATREPYFKLSFDYWFEEWDAKLSLPAKAVLLIALSLRGGFSLPGGKAPLWYGISTDTVQRGLTALQGYGLLECEKRFKKAPLSPLGYTEDYRYSLNQPFAQRTQQTDSTTSNKAEG